MNGSIYSVKSIPLKYWTSDVRAVLKSLEDTCNNPATVEGESGRNRLNDTDALIKKQH